MSFTTLIFYLQFVVLISTVTTVVPSPKHCDRRRSRMVRKVVTEKLLPAYAELHTELSEECLFSTSRDIYRTQESHKSSLDSSHWYCHFCGKGFVSENFLDLHFENRHADQLEVENSLCLADVCEVFRCDILGKVISPDFWDVALCLEDDMKSLHRKCASMVKSCVPSGLTENTTRWLTDFTMRELCSYLTCSKYWDIPFDSTNMSATAGLYVVLTVMVVFGVTIYYCLFYAYFFTDAFADSLAYEPMPRSRHSIKPYTGEVRKRPRSVRSTHSD